LAGEQIQDDDPDVGLVPDGNDYGDYYYLGFNDLFDNWYVTSRGTNPEDFETRPKSPKFRVGLRHGNADVDAGDAGFDYYRITIEDSNGDLLGFLARTIDAGPTYSGNVITFGGTDLVSTDDITEGTDDTAVVSVITNVKLTNRVDGGPREAYYAATVGLTSPTDGGLTFGNVTALAVYAVDDPADSPAADVLYAHPPQEYYDFQRDVFEGDGVYTINAWAENDDGTRISPQASVELSVQEGTAVEGAQFSGYTGDVRVFPGSPETNVNLAVWGFSIWDN
jgi:hypothetical protein